MAMVRGLSEVCEGDASKYIHSGATSYDVEDTAFALQLGQAIDVIYDSARTFLAILVNQAEENAQFTCIGRTHGQHALPTYIWHAVWRMGCGVWAASRSLA